ncbi:MAG: type II toxin-antitoxin system prevent-host-death family antitoxin [Coriobacteriales bacterium]|jgi:prevent-host-death family protein|nr:type II toxin-antitoxin system prevent-host-death family antitoxin [Coriobacteriales bacterium]
MPTYPIAEVKSQLSMIIKQVEEGHTVLITRGVRKEEVAAIVPIAEWRNSTKQKRQLGSLSGKMKVSFADDWYISDEELLGNDV